MDRQLVVLVENLLQVLVQGSQGDSLKCKRGPDSKSKHMAIQRYTKRERMKLSVWFSHHWFEL